MAWEEGSDGEGRARVSIAILTGVACAPDQARGSIDGPIGAATSVGTSHGSMVDKPGNFTFTTNAGVTSSERFACRTVENARGIFDRGDGQGGPFDLTRTGDRWVRTGIVGNRRGAIELGYS